MAQAVFEEHPLEEYLRDTGESPEFMPGNAPDLMLELNEEMEGEFSEGQVLWPTILTPYIQMLSSFFLGHMAKQSSPFAERFKYDVISSSLLESSLPIPHSHPIRSHSPPLPGTLEHAPLGSQSDSGHQPLHSFKALTTDPTYWVSSILLAFAILFFSAGYYFLGVLVASATVLFVYISSTDIHAKRDMTSTLDGLRDLITANNAWDSAVHEAVSLLEKDEQNTFASGSSSPSSSLRVALSSTLHTTQTQCDNVRQLFMALTSPIELSQLSEMYAPASPMPSKPSFLPPSPQPNSQGLRPISLPASQRLKRTSSLTRFDAKRTTWNGSYSSLANAGSPTMQSLKRREKRRSDLSAILNISGSAAFSGSSSVPATPSPAALAGVQEQQWDDESYFEDDHLRPFYSISIPPSPEIDGEVQISIVEGQEKDGDEAENFVFGSAALGLRRQRKSGGLEMLGLQHQHQQSHSPSQSSPRYLHFPPSSAAGATTHSHPHSPLSPSFTGPSPHLTPRSPRTPASTISASSRFTTLQTPRHPLSLSALNQAIHGALASKRHACSHLLALRFDEEESDDGYWEDVRSVVSLLTSSIADASARLVEALDEVEAVRLKDENPSPESIAAHSRVGSLGDDIELANPSSRFRKARTMEQMGSFAPIPSHLARFAAHVDAIASALNDARENLEQCVASLKESHQDGLEPTSSPSRSSATDDHHPALLAYERLRRELGLALRECERGRERLLDLTMPPRGDDPERADPADDVPGLSHDASDDSDKQDSNSPADDEVMSLDHPPLISVAGDNPDAIDDVTSHLLLATSSQHLPAPGLEQVFESDAGSAAIFNRERSKLSRDERIALAKKARESGRSVLPPPPVRDEDDPAIATENTGPGVDVVQELKDVIWKVGERRRKMADST